MGKTKTTSQLNLTLIRAKLRIIVTNPSGLDIDLRTKTGEASKVDNITPRSNMHKDWPHLANLIFAIFSAFLLAITPAQAKNTKYAAFIMHAESGDILFDRYSTQTRYPASLTKMMTLYLLFEELEAGRITLKSKLKVSKTAAGQPPSKLGVSSGSTISVETAIKALVVKSANDVAVVVAERIGGSEWKFARLMTQRARQIGMRKTTFRNASGLPNSKQVTTARDMAELSRRLFQDFPQYKHYFTTKQFTWNKRTYTTHNSLVKNYPGADGIKTGYTRRSGFNLATSAVRDDVKLIGIVLGGRSSYTRDKHMREILDKAFAEVKRKPQLISALYRNPPNPRLKPSPYGDAPTIADNTFLQARLNEASRGFSTAGVDDPLGSLIVSNNAAPTNQAQNDLLAGLITREDNSFATGEGDIDDIAALASSISSPVNNTPTISVPPPANNGINSLGWAVQIGAYSTEDYAQNEIEKAASMAGLTSIPRRVIPLVVNKKPTLYRARFFYSDRNAADEGCSVLKARGVGCFVTNSPAQSS